MLLEVGTPAPAFTAGAFASLDGAFAEQNAVVLGVSKDSPASHRRFADKYALPFRLLADTEKSVLQAYGVWQEKKLYGKVSMGVVRTTYVIDEHGVVEKVLPKVKPDTNAAELLAYLRERT